MKINKERDKDCYLYINNGEIIEEEKEGSDIKIMENNPNKIDNKNKSKDLYDNLSEYTNKLPNRKTFNRILITVVSIICIALIFSLVRVSKSLSVSNNLTNTNKAIEDTYFIADVIQNSNKCLLDYYNGISTLIIRDKINDLDKKIISIKEMVNQDLIDISSIDKHISSKSLKNAIDILKIRFKNLLALCEALESNPSSKYVDIYNTYANIEIEEQSKLIKELTNQFDILNIEYTVDSNNSITYKK